jgi:hypothetical protein
MYAQMIILKPLVVLNGGLSGGDSLLLKNVLLMIPIFF